MAEQLPQPHAHLGVAHPLVGMRWRSVIRVGQKAAASIAFSAERLVVRGRVRRSRRIATGWQPRGCFSLDCLEHQFSGRLFLLRGPGDPLYDAVPSAAPAALPRERSERAMQPAPVALPLGWHFPHPLARAAVLASSGIGVSKTMRVTPVEGCRARGSARRPLLGTVRGFCGYDVRLLLAAAPTPLISSGLKNRDAGRSAG